MDNATESKGDEPTIAAADSLYGQLQRGRGSGFLRSIQEDATTIQPLLLDCISHDPRWDRQLESRSQYFARLIQQIDLPLEPIATQLRSLVADEEHDAEAYLFSIVEELARCRVTGAEHILRDYLTYGCEWEDALETIAEVSDVPLDITAVSQLIDQRFPDDEMLATNLTFLALRSPSDVWAELRRMNTRIEHMLSTQEKARAHSKRAEERARARLVGLSASELLALDINSGNARDIARMLRKCVTADDRDRLMHLAQEGNKWQRFVAFYALEPIADVSMLPMLLAFLDKQSMAFECLWDSEDEVVAIGCDMVDIGVAEALTKVQALASDPYEDDYVRAAATKRLTAS